MFIRPKKMCPPFSYCLTYRYACHNFRTKNERFLVWRQNLIERGRVTLLFDTQPHPIQAHILQCLLFLQLILFYDVISFVLASQSNTAWDSELNGLMTIDHNVESESDVSQEIIFDTHVIVTVCFIIYELVCQYVFHLGMDGTRYIPRYCGGTSVELCKDIVALDLRIRSPNREGHIRFPYGSVARSFRRNCNASAGEQCCALKYKETHVDLGANMCGSFDFMTAYSMTSYNLLSNLHLQCILYRY